MVMVGLLSIWPFVYMGLFFALMFAFWFQTTAEEHGSSLFKLIFPLHCGTMLLTFILVGVYVVHLFRTDAIPSDKKALWAVVLFLGNLMAFPFYWYLYMWRPLGQAPGAERHDDGAAGERQS